jgi:hypothetical protein
LLAIYKDNGLDSAFDALQVDQKIDNEEDEWDKNCTQYRI